MMAIADKTIIDPEDTKPGIPIKKGTIGMIVALLAGITVVTALFMESQNTSAKKAAPKAVEKVAAGTPTGSAAAIDEERKKADVAQQEFERQQRARDRAVAAAAATSGPLPAGMPANRNASDGPVLAGTGQSVNSRVAKAKGRQDMSDAEAETEAASRVAKAVAFDDSGSDSAGMSAQDRRAAERGLPPGADRELSALGFTMGADGRLQAPSAVARNGTDASLEAMRAAAGMPPPGFGAPAGGNPAAANKQWLNEYASEATSQKRNDVVKSYRTESRFTLHQGKTIPAVIGRKINSDLPGEITAYTTLDVYDSLGNGALLIPKGSALVGRYNSEVKVGQERVMFAFQRLIMPNGISFDLPAAQGSDLTGAAGQEGDVNNHFFKMFASSFLVAWASDRVAQPANVTVNPGASSTGTTSPAGQVLVDVGRTILDRNRNIAPTITIDQGTRINVQVAKDMEFAGPYLRSTK